MRCLILAFFTAFFVVACGSPVNRTAYVSLDKCDLFIPDGYFVNSGSIRDAGVTIISSLSNEEFGSISIEHGAEEILADYERDRHRVRFIEEHRVGEYRYVLLGITFGEGRDEQKVIRAQIGSYSLSIVGHAKSIWKQHLVC